MLPCSPIHYSSFMFFSLSKDSAAWRPPRPAAGKLYHLLVVWLPVVGGCGVWGGKSHPKHIRKGDCLQSNVLGSSNMLLRCCANVALFTWSCNFHQPLDALLSCSCRSSELKEKFRPNPFQNSAFSFNLKRLAGVGRNHDEPPKSGKYHWKTTWCDKWQAIL